MNRCAAQSFTSNVGQLALWLRLAGHRREASNIIFVASTYSSLYLPPRRHHARARILHKLHITYVSVWRPAMNRMPPRGSVA